MADSWTRESGARRVARWGWAIPLVCLLLWCAIGMLWLLLPHEQDPDVARALLLVTLAAGSLFAGLAGALGLILVQAAADEVFTAEPVGARVRPLEEMDVPEEAIPADLVDAWEMLIDAYDEDFASWTVARAPIGIRGDDLEQLGDQLWPEWQKAQHRDPVRRLTVARREAAAAVVGISLGMIPSLAAVDRDGRRGWEGGTRFFPAVPRLDAADEAWLLLQVAAAGPVIDRAAGRGAVDDLDEVHRQALDLVASRGRPAGFTGTLSMGTVVAEAFASAERLLVRHARAVDAVTAELVARRLLGGYELRRIFAEHPPEKP